MKDQGGYRATLFAFCLLVMPTGNAGETVAAVTPDPEDGQDSAVYYMGKPFPGEPVSGSYLRTQQLFDAYYAQQDYKEAHKVLVKGLIWRGDKHAQYMLGVMYWNGEGMRTDRVKGAAWFRLAAQRGNSRLMALRDQAWATLTPGQQEQAAVEFEAIRDQYGDRAVIKRLLRRDGWSQNRSLTEHVTAAGGNLQMLDGSGIAQRGTQYTSRRDEWIHRRLEYLGGYVEFGELQMIGDEASATAKLDGSGDSSE